MVTAYRGILPTVHETVFLAEGAVVIGDVQIGAHSNVWFGCVVRGDVNHIRIGERTNIQDGTVVHVTRKTPDAPAGHPTIIGNGVTVGHQAILHGCILEDDCFVGMGAIVMDGAVVESGAMVAAGALVAPGKRVPAGELWAGNPARYFRDLNAGEKAYIPISAEHYVKLAAEYR